MVCKNKWTDEEIEKLKLLYEEHGEGCFKKVPKFIEARTPRGARQIWRYHLNQEVIKTPFTDEERKKIMDLKEIKKIGWSQMEKYFEGRDQIRLKNEYRKIKRNEKRQVIAPNAAKEEINHLNDYSLYDFPRFEELFHQDKIQETFFDDFDVL
jgi:hypothetical protein